MNRFSTFFVFASAAMGAFSSDLTAKPREGVDGPAERLTIRVYDYARLPDADYEQARGHAERVFSKAGVPTRWIRCASKPGEPTDPDCKGIITSTDLVLRIMPEAMASRVPVTGKTFGYAVPSRDQRFGTVANVFHHRVSELIARMRRRAGGRLYSQAAVLGHVMAHELGHVLLGHGSHSRSGIMAFPWGPKQLRACLDGGLLFSKPQAKKIRGDVRERRQARGTS